MPYQDYMKAIVRKVEATRARRIAESREDKHHPRIPGDEVDDFLVRYHPDYMDGTKRAVAVGPNADDTVPNEFADILESRCLIGPQDVDLGRADYETDVLVIGGGGAASAAALTAYGLGMKVLMATKLRLGDANTMMAEGGIQAAGKPQDSPARHYLDAMGGGHFTNDPGLVEALTMDAPMTIAWLERLGMMFDKEPGGAMKVLHGGGTSRKRMLSCRDYSGSGILRVLRDEVECRSENIRLMEFTPAVELIRDADGTVAGAVVQNFETDEYFVIKAGATILTTGGLGRLHTQGFPTSNHYGATCDGVVLGYRAGAKTIFMDSVQYHPTGAVFPEQIVGFLVTEKVRGLGGQPLNIDGELFVFPLEPRDVEASAIIRECRGREKGLLTPSGQVGVWLDSPIIDELHGPGTIEKELPAMVRQFNRFNIDITKEPMLIFPTLHFQNGGLDVNPDCETTLPGLYAAGEVQGGTHGRNRLMGNSQLEITVFGRRAGIAAARYALERRGRSTPLTMEHVFAYCRELEQAGIDRSRIAPILLPDYLPEHVKAKRYAAGMPADVRT